MEQKLDDSSAAEGVKAEQPQLRVTLKVRSQVRYRHVLIQPGALTLKQTDGSQISFSIKKASPLMHLMESWATRVNLNVKEIKCVTASV